MQSGIVWNKGLLGLADRCRDHGAGNLDALS